MASRLNFIGVGLLSCFLFACESFDANPESRVSVTDITSSCSYYNKEDCEQWDKQIGVIEGLVYFEKSASDVSVFLYPPTSTHEMALEDYWNSAETEDWIVIQHDLLDNSQLASLKKLHGKDVTIKALTNVDCVVSDEYGNAQHEYMYNHVFVAIRFCEKYGSVFLTDALILENEQ